ncbi:MAG: hypothetical protein JOZ63_20530 [Planctomycetaceae bacterium]|nr:hypothetical protein [Planctomycetaceae bacterium]
MRTENPPPLASAWARLRAQAARFRRSILTRRTATRWLLALGALALLGVLGYLARPSPVSNTYLLAGMQFSQDDLIEIQRALEAKHFDARSYRVDDEGRIEVAANRIDEATDIVIKLNVGKPSLTHIKNQAREFSGPFVGPWEREQHELEVREQVLAAMIQKLDGIMSADVTIHRPKGRGAGRQPARATAFVYVETRGGRELSPKAVEAIQNLMAREHDLTHDAVTVCDDHGRRYLVAGDPMGVRSNLLRAREEELSEKILEQINWVKGVGVTVQLIPSPAPTPAPIPAHPAPVEEPRPPDWEVVPNHPLELVEPTPTPAPEPAPALHPVASAAPPKQADEPVIARVWVKVPRSFYYLKALPNREPSPGDLQPIVTRTETLIRTAVAHAIPPGQLSEPVVIDTIPDDVPVSRPLSASDVPASRRVISWWVPAGVGGGLMAALLFIGVRLRASRRPTTRPASASGRSRIEGVGASAAGQSAAERVRELIRLNPEAAAGVLHRWIGQGGHLP